MRLRARWILVLLVLGPSGCVRAFSSTSSATVDGLSADSRRPDGAQRDGSFEASGPVDGVGADRSLPPPPVDTVFYSVGQNTDDHKTGTPTVAIAQGLATFTVPQTAANLGVGDIVEYGAQSSCFLSQKVSTSVWRCTTAQGGIPAPVIAEPVKAISHAFGSLSAAIAGARDATHLGSGDLVQLGVSLSLPCYCDAGAADAGRVVVSGYVTSAQRRIRIYTPTDPTTECNSRQRHAGVWNGARYRLEVLNVGWEEASLTIRVPNTTIDGLQVLASGPGSVDGIQTTGGPAGPYFISNTIVRGILTSGSVNSDGICTHFGAAGQKVQVWNNIIYGFDQGSAQAAGLYTQETTMVAYNNTVVGCLTGILRAGGTLVARNNLVQSINKGFAGSFDAASSHNLSNKGDAPGAQSKTTTVSFVDGAGHDYHLAPTDTAAAGAGVDLSADATLAFGVDIDGEARAAPWEIGADERP